MTPIRAGYAARRWLAACAAAAAMLCAVPTHAGFADIASGTYASVLAAGHGPHARHFRHGYGHHRYDAYRHHRYDRARDHRARDHRYRDHRYRHHHRSHHSSRGEYLLGGVVIGSILGHALSSTRDYPPSRVVHYERVVVEPRVRRTRVIEPAVTRRLYRDIDGNCFERRQDGTGSELLVELPAEACAW